MQVGFVTLIIGGKHIGDYRHVIVTYTWEPPNEGQARFVLEDASPRTPLVVNKADNYDMIVDLRGGKKNQRKTFMNYKISSAVILMSVFRLGISQLCCFLLRRGCRRSLRDR